MTFEKLWDVGHQVSDAISGVYSGVDKSSRQVPNPLIKLGITVGKFTVNNSIFVRLNEGAPIQEQAGPEVLKRNGVRVVFSTLNRQM